jgi:translation initiation factor eIF-2B subunit alpha
MRGIKFNVIVTDSQPAGTGTKIKAILEENHVPTKVIYDGAVAVAMNNIDCVFVGCEAVVENGGIVNKIGTYTTALCAKTF